MRGGGPEHKGLGWWTLWWRQARSSPQPLGQRGLGRWVCSALGLRAGPLAPSLWPWDAGALPPGGGEEETSVKSPAQGHKTVKYKRGRLNPKTFLLQTSWLPTKEGVLSAVLCRARKLSLLNPVGVCGATVIRHSALHGAPLCGCQHLPVEPGVTFAVLPEVSL